MPSNINLKAKAFVTIGKVLPRKADTILHLIMHPTEPLAEGSYLLQRFAGKGGWTYAEIPEIPMDPHAPFGWVCVKGSIDQYHFDQYRLMPMGNGRLFLPLKAAVRKEIGKTAGDRVWIVLYADTIRGEIPEELAAGLRDEPLAWQRFQQLPPEVRKKMVDQIYNALKTETRAERIVQLITELLR